MTKELLKSTSVSISRYTALLGTIISMTNRKSYKLLTHLERLMYA